MSKCSGGRRGRAGAWGGARDALRFYREQRQRIATLGFKCVGGGETRVVATLGSQKDNIGGPSETKKCA